MTHASITDPKSRLYRKAAGREAKLCYMGHVTMENRHGVNGARNFPNYGEVKFPSLAGGVIRRRFDRGLRFLAAVRDV